jgi:dGTPase
MDLEDGFSLGLVSFKETEELLKNLIRVDIVKDYNERDESDRIGYLRAKSINELIKELAEVFLDNEDRILNAKLEEELITLIPGAKGLEEIESFRLKKYTVIGVLLKEKQPDMKYSADYLIHS